ncbi:hypothetical protein B0G76_1954 [Paraburkholderia sp. BL23I1N1]|nr:hypothetical protein B0G76_1954 [Paraburkholderia sp. BL23I1N1]
MAAGEVPLRLHHVLTTATQLIWWLAAQTQAPQTRIAGCRILYGAKRLNRRVDVGLTVLTVARRAKR